MNGPRPCRYCSSYHGGEASIVNCGLQRAGFRWRDADGYLANGPYTRPHGNGLPVQPVTMWHPGVVEEWAQHLLLGMAEPEPEPEPNPEPEPGQLLLPIFGQT